MDHAKLLDVLTSLPVSHVILPRAIRFATSRPANHAICSFIDSSGYASGPIRRCLFIDYIINGYKWSFCFFKAAYSVTMNIFRNFYFLFKSFVKVELSYVFTIKMFSIAENCVEK